MREPRERLSDRGERGGGEAGSDSVVRISIFGWFLMGVGIEEVLMG